jgi:hypothetical protein
MESEWNSSKSRRQLIECSTGAKARPQPNLMEPPQPLYLKPSTSKESISAASSSIKTVPPEKKYLPTKSAPTRVGLIPSLKQPAGVVSKTHREAAPWLSWKFDRSLNGM